MSACCRDRFGTHWTISRYYILPLNVRFWSGWCSHGINGKKDVSAADLAANQSDKLVTNTKRIITTMSLLTVSRLPFNISYLHLKNLFLSVSINDFQLFRHERKKKLGGGSALYVNFNIDCKSHSKIMEFMENLWKSKSNQVRESKIKVVYNPPDKHK